MFCVPGSWTWSSCGDSGTPSDYCYCTGSHLIKNTKEEKERWELFFEVRPDLHCNEPIHGYDPLLIPVCLLQNLGESNVAVLKGVKSFELTE